MSVYADSYEELRYCGHKDVDGDMCPFYGEVEIVFDPESEYETWECPLCTVMHEAGWTGTHYWDDDEFGDWDAPVHDVL